MSLKTISDNFIDAIQLNNNDGEVIPFGWQKVEDAEYGTFYIE